MADVATVLAICDEEYQAALDWLRPHEQQFFGSNGRYWQGILVPATVPADGNTVRVPQNPGRPTDEKTPWPAQIRGRDIHQQVAAHKYLSPAGPGWLAERRVLINGDFYQTIDDHGPAGLSYAWMINGLGDPGPPPLDLA